MFGVITIICFVCTKSIRQYIHVLGVVEVLVTLCVGEREIKEGGQVGDMEGECVGRLPQHPLHFCYENQHYRQSHSRILMSP